MAKEGGVTAIAILAQVEHSTAHRQAVPQPILSSRWCPPPQVVDKQVRKECCQALANLSSEPGIENGMIIEGAAQVLLDIVKTGGSYTKE